MPLGGISEGLNFLSSRLRDSQSVKALELVEQGWQAAYAELFGQTFVDVLAPHHVEAIEWHWDSRLAFLTGERPEYLAYFPIWPRGHMKSTIAERMVVADAILSVAYDQPGFCLYLGREKHKVKENISNIETLFASAPVRKYAPSLSQVAKNDVTDQKKQWSATFLHTQGNYIVKGGSIESTQAGSRVDETRPTFIVPDDIDGREDSEVISNTRFKRLTGEILPMRQGNTLVYFAQNLITRFSVMYKIHKQHVQVLTNRKPTKPIPAVLNLVTEQRTDESGMIRDWYVSGESTWPYWDAQRIQDEIDTEGLPAFLKECQHQVEGTKEGLFHKQYNDDIHPISYSQFDAVFGPDAWKDWYKVPFNDWSRTKTKYHANVAGFLAVSSQNTKYPGLTFCIPKSYPADSTVPDVAASLLSTLTPYAYGENGDRVTWADLIDQAWKRTNAHKHFDTVAERLQYERNYYAQIIPKYSRKVLSAYNVRGGAMSHSEDKVRELFNDGFGFSFEPSNPGKTEALEQIDMAMRVDYDAAHLFKPDVKGYTRFYVLCPDDKTQEAVNVNGYPTYPPGPYPEDLKPDDLHDSALFRYQMCNRRFKPAKLVEGGEIVDEPEKANDDFGQALQMVYFLGLLRNIQLTVDERIREHLEARVPESSIQEADPESASMLMTQKMHLAQELRAEIAKPTAPGWSGIG